MVKLDSTMILCTALALTFAGCTEDTSESGSSEDDSSEDDSSEDDSSEDDSAIDAGGKQIDPGVESFAVNNRPASLTSSKSFYISNPNGKSKKYRVTPSCGAGTLYMLALPALNTHWYQTQAGNQYYASYQCQNVGTLKVTVYCTNGTPKLTYWFYDC